MLTLLRTNSENISFKNLVKLLDADLQVRDGDEHAFYTQFNKIENIKNVLVGFVENIPVCIGAYRKYNESTVEIKRMYVMLEYRGKGYASNMLSELEKWAAENRYSSAVLETGKKQPEAIFLYKKNGYKIISNYGQYINVENSICMMKNI